MVRSLGLISRQVGIIAQTDISKKCYIAFVYSNMIHEPDFGFVEFEDKEIAEQAMDGVNGQSEVVAAQPLMQALFCINDIFAKLSRRDLLSNGQKMAVNVLVQMNASTADRKVRKKNHSGTYWERAQSIEIFTGTQQATGPRTAANQSATADEATDGAVVVLLDAIIATEGTAFPSMKLLRCSSHWARLKRLQAM